jgi:hypothetical protein
VTHPGPFRRMYTGSTAGGLLGMDPGVLRKRALRGRVSALKPHSASNPFREWLFDADDVDREARGTSSTAVWLPDETAPRSPDSSGEWAEVDHGLGLERDRLLTDYRDHVDVLTAEAAVEREVRLVAERRIVEAERDNALRELKRVERAFRSLAATVLADDER